jgi:hypothetical protein
MHRNVHGEREARSRAVHHPAMQVGPGREGDGVEQRVEPPPAFGNPGEHGLELARDRDVERRHDRGTELFRQRPDVRLGAFVEPGHRQVGALRLQRLRAPPRDRVLIGDPDDKRLPSPQ